MRRQLILHINFTSPNSLEEDQHIWASESEFRSGDIKVAIGLSQPKYEAILSGEVIDAPPPANHGRANHPSDA